MFIYTVINSNTWKWTFYPGELLEALSHRALSGRATLWGCCSGAQTELGGRSRGWRRHEELPKFCEPASVCVMDRAALDWRPKLAWNSGEFLNITTAGGSLHLIGILLCHHKCYRPSVRRWKLLFQVVFAFNWHSDNTREFSEVCHMNTCTYLQGIFYQLHFDAEIHQRNGWSRDFGSCSNSNSYIRSNVS